MTQRASITNDALNVDVLIGGDAPLIDRKVTIPSGTAKLKRGSVIGKITASGKYILSLSAASDGSQTPVAILAEDMDAAATADIDVLAYFAGAFRTEALTIGAGHTAASIIDGLHDRAIYLR